MNDHINPLTTGLFKMFQFLILFTVKYNVFVWNWSKYNARASLAIVQITRPCVSSHLWVDKWFHLYFIEIDSYITKCVHTIYFSDRMIVHPGVRLYHYLCPTGDGPIFLPPHEAYHVLILDCPQLSDITVRYRLKHLVWTQKNCSNSTVSNHLSFTTIFPNVRSPLS